MIRDYFKSGTEIREHAVSKFNGQINETYGGFGIIDELELISGPHRITVKCDMSDISNGKDPKSPNITSFEFLGGYRLLSSDGTLGASDEYIIRFTMPECKYPILTIGFGSIIGVTDNDGTYSSHSYILHKADIEPFLKSKAFKPKSSFIYTIQGKNQQIEAVEIDKRIASWEGVIMAPEIKQAVMDDFLYFIDPKNRGFFTDHGLSYRRGYLLFGNPGNGKSSILRAMACCDGVQAYQFEFSSSATIADFKKLVNYAINDLNDIEEGEDKKIALFILEDIDRISGSSTEADVKDNASIGMQGLLNQIDGICNMDGIVFAATANDPRNLDPAIINRPGRFDQIVEVKGPSDEMIREYYRQIGRGTIPDDQITIIIKAASGSSYAALREFFIRAKSKAIMAKREMTGQDVVNACHEYQKHTEEVARYRMKRGSKSDTSTKAGF